MLDFFPSNPDIHVFLGYIVRLAIQNYSVLVLSTCVTNFQIIRKCAYPFPSHTENKPIPAPHQHANTRPRSSTNSRSFISSSAAPLHLIPNPRRPPLHPPIRLLRHISSSAAVLHLFFLSPVAGSISFGGVYSIIQFE